MDRSGSDKTGNGSPSFSTHARADSGSRSLTPNIRMFLFWKSERLSRYPWLWRVQLLPPGEEKNHSQTFCPLRSDSLTTFPAWSIAENSGARSPSLSTLIPPMMLFGVALR